MAECANLTKAVQDIIFLISSAQEIKFQVSLLKWYIKLRNTIYIPCYCFSY